MNRIRVDSVEEAVRAAEQLKRTGRTFWFRGQAQDWPLRSSFLRVKPEDRPLVLEKLARYEAWITQTPGLENLAADTDAAIAVAQHYGLPTNLTDLTTEPQIAGYFASEGAGPHTATDLACIICLDVEDLEESWQPLVSYCPPPEFLELSVPDLWRLEAQHGCFLFCPHHDVERLYELDRILFPNAHPLRSVRRDEVYPERKSHLEVLLDQYFMNERMIEAERAWKPGGMTRLANEAPAGGCDPEVYPDGIPEHPSWSGAALGPWLELRAEPFGEARTDVRFRVWLADPQSPTHVVREVAQQLLHDLSASPGIRSKLVGWDVQMVGDYGLPPDLISGLAPRLTRLWDGLRRLPYSDEDLCAGIGRCVAFAAALGGDWRNPDLAHWERAAHQCLTEPVELQFGAEDGSYSRGYASVAGLAGAIRRDILSFVSDRWKGRLAGNVREILQTAWDPRKVTDHTLLAPLFAREIAPYQVLARDTAVFYSPARLVSLTVQ